jgi:uncharacterized membrane protein YccC
VAASDPGLGRLRTGLSAAVCVGTALPVQLVVGRVLGFTGQGAMATAMFGAVVAMLGSNALTGWDRWVKVRTAAFFPVAVGLGLLVATLTEAQRALQVLGFALVLFLSVWVRRFGPQFFFYGFMGWMGFFFATFLHATWSLVPSLLIAAAVSTGWVLLLSTTVFSTSPRRTLHATNAAFFARGRTVARACAELLEVPTGAERRRRHAHRVVTARQAGVAETALLAEAWSVEGGAMPEGWSAAALRRRLIEAQQAVERIAGSATRLHGRDPALVALAHRALDAVAHHQDDAATAAADQLAAAAMDLEQADGDGWWPARHLAHGVREFLRFDAAIDEPPEVDPGEDEFEAATTLVNGDLPGSPAVARDVTPRGHWNPASRLSMTSRQAVQVALAGLIAIGLGTVLSPTRYYWAVIAAFVMFAGTGTRSETLLKGAARVGGTFAGLIAAIAVAHLTYGHTPVIITVILVSVFFTFYLAKVSQAAMTFFVTILLGQLYTVLGMFSDSLLVLRLGETAAGAVAGTAVALLFAPVSTRDTVRSARDEMLTAMVEFLEEAARYAEDTAAGRTTRQPGTGSGGLRLDACTRTLDDRARKLTLVTQPLTRPLVMGNSSPRTRRRLSLYTAAVSQCRSLSLALQRRPESATATAATAARAVAQAARALMAQPPGAAVPDAERPLADGDLALFGDRASAHADDPVVRSLHHLASTLSQVAQTPATAAEPRHRA